MLKVNIQKSDSQLNVEVTCLKTQLKGSMQKQHHRNFAVFGLVRNLSIFHWFLYYVWKFSLYLQD